MFWVATNSCCCFFKKNEFTTAIIVKIEVVLDIQPRLYVQYHRGFNYNRGDMSLFLPIFAHSRNLLPRFLRNRDGMLHFPVRLFNRDGSALVLFNVVRSTAVQSRICKPLNMFFLLVKVWILERPK